ncbi:MAG TPA: bifunctional UDP-sugar hydrolase/5'-nucleotidase [Xanthobacteraceae bacterium]
MSGNKLRHLAAAVWLAATLILAHGAAWAETAKVTFILMNDIYQMGETAMPDGKSRGGFARLAAVVKAERERARSLGGHVILAHGGDTLSPSLMSGIDQGAHIMVLTNMLKPDIFAPGNHEFDFGKAVFIKRMGEANFPRFAANMRTADGQPLAGFKDREIVTVDGVRIGLTGAAHEDTPRMSSPEDLKFAPAGAVMREQAEALRREGADFVVAVMHVDRYRGQDVIESRAVDLVLTGHNHDLFIQFDGRAAMVESGYDAHYVTLIDVTIEVKQQDRARAVAWWPQFRVVDTATVTPDPEVAAAVASLEQELSREMDVPLGTTSVELDSRNATVRGREAAIGNLIADAMRARGRADVGLMNGGGIRAGKVYPPGSPVTRRDVLAELPFGNHMVTIEVKGADLRAAIENGLSRLPALAGRFPHVSGMRVEYDPRRPPGSRVLSIAVGGAPLSPTRVYRVTTNDFVARGSDGYTSLTNIKPVVPLDDTPRLSNEVMVYLREQGGIRTGVDGRMRAK